MTTTNRLFENSLQTGKNPFKIFKRRHIEIIDHTGYTIIILRCWVWRFQKINACYFQLSIKKTRKTHKQNKKHQPTGETTLKMSAWLLHLSWSINLHSVNYFCAFESARVWYVYFHKLSTFFCKNSGVKFVFLFLGVNFVFISRKIWLLKYIYYIYNIDVYLFSKVKPP